MSSPGSHHKGKATEPVPPKTQTRHDDPESDDEDEKRIKALEHQIHTLVSELNVFSDKHEREIRDLRDASEQTQEQVKGSAPATAISGIKLPKAESFDGTRSRLRGFLTQMDMHLDMNKRRLVGEADKVIFVSSYLRGQAWDWLEPYIREYYEKAPGEWTTTAQSIFMSYRNFRQILERTFGDIDAKATAERKLARTRQQTSATAYVAEFMSYAAILGWDDYALIPPFYSGLKSHVKDEIARIGRPNTMSDFIDTVVRIDNRFYDRQREEREMKQWRRNPGRGDSGRFRRHERPQRNNDPYGPRPMELDAVRLPDEEQRRRKEKNLCFKCGKPGHRSRECKKRDERPHQIRATKEKLDRGAYDTTGVVRTEGKTQQLRATQEEGWTGPLIVDGSRPPTPKGQTAEAAHGKQATGPDGPEPKGNKPQGTSDQQGRRTTDQGPGWLMSPGPQATRDTEPFPEIDWETIDSDPESHTKSNEQIESQGWTQYGPWNTIDSQEQLVDSQEWVTDIPGTPTRLPGVQEVLGTTTNSSQEGTTILETPTESPRNEEKPQHIDAEQAGKEFDSAIEELERWSDSLIRQQEQLRQTNNHLQQRLQDTSSDETTGHQDESVREEQTTKQDIGCPCTKHDCACTGYARHPRHGARAIIGCYDDNCTTHYQGKLDIGIEPRPLRWEKPPQWRHEFAGTWYGDKKIDEPLNLAATSWGAHMKIWTNLAFQKTQVMIDSGASGNFISPRYCQQNNVEKKEKKNVSPIIGLNGERLGPGITHETGRLPMIVGNHFETINFDITNLGEYDVVIGIPWLRQHNPAIDWRNGTIVFDRCKCRQTSETWTGLAPEQQKGPSSGEAGDPRDSHEDELKRSTRPRGGAQHKTMDVSVIATIEQRPDMTQDELEDYVMVEHESRSLCAIADGEEALVPDEYREYQDVFTPPAEGTLPAHDEFDHEINTQDGKDPKFMPIYQLSQKESETLREYIDENLRKGYIRKSTSPAGYPILFVPKKDGSLRLCVDYRQLNSITIKDRHPLPLISEIQDRIQGANYFTKYDITNAYNRLRIKEGHEWKTAFRTKFGHFEYVVMPFGLTNAPASFQRFIFSVLGKDLDTFVIAYLDDILVFSKTEAEHVEHNRKVLQRLRTAKVTLKPKKCEFHVQETTFLGYTISPQGLGMEEEKIKAITDWPTPKNTRDVQSFLGLCNYYRKLVPQYSKHAAGLYRFTKKNETFQWDDAAEETFQNLKSLYTKDRIVRVFNYNQPCTMETDASDYALGAQLLQPDEEGTMHPVAFWSRKMIPAELNYDIHDKELLAIVSAFQVWRAYLEGAKHTVTVRTDHHNLTFFTTTKKLTRRQARWAETLSQYDFRIVQCKGTENAVADALSRRPDYELGTKEAEPAILTTNDQGEIVYNRQTLAATSEPEDDGWLDQLRRATAEDESMQKILATDQYGAMSDEGLVLVHGLIYVPRPLQTEAIRKHHDLPTHGHQGIDKTVEQISRNYYIPNMHRKVRGYIRNCDTCQRDKISRHLPYGEMQVADTPTRPWEWITMDFITKLPESDGCDMVMVIVDRLTKYAYMIATTETIDANRMANLLLRYVFANHGTPDKITSDRDKLFTSNMWQSFADQMGIEHRLSTAYHPQTNGQTERVNQTLEQYLRHHINYQQDNWAGLLPIAQFAYNNAMHATTKETPFFANYGYNPKLIGEPRNKHNVAESARLLATGVRQLHLQMARDIEFLNLRMKMHYDQRHQAGPDLKKGEKVYLLRRNIKTKRPSDKLDHRKLGPFTIDEKTGPVNYRLKLPESMGRIHPVFHVSLLEHAPENAELATNVEIEEETEDEYEVEAITKDRWYNGQQQLLVKWKGYPTSENTWEPIAHLRGCHQLVQQYYLEMKKTPQGRKQRKRRSQRCSSPLTDQQTQSSASE